MTNRLTANNLADMKERAPEVAELLRFMATPSRLLLLCQLSQGESTVGALEEATGIRQPALSQQLAELRQRHLVTTRRESRSVFYRINDSRVEAMLVAMHRIFCVDQSDDRE
ncbi:putative transcriptional regulator, ArsR family [Stenotrophomonas maltophilia EPM1]|nr:metalloregulator ArsR/SmtB family transcription factor [uncultured Acidovorax sp.]EMF60695.1 putative transcriptional regulator, ArsR family [Stenotrophomonas maltophilia EPM1]NYF35112.1 ArsR family transcriptional regulator [Stenotrophomonas sp. JAI102]